MIVIYVALGVVLGLIIYNNLLACIEIATSLLAFMVMLALFGGVIFGIVYICWLAFGDKAQFVLKHASWVDLWIIPFIVALSFAYYFVAFGFKKKEPEVVNTQE